MKPFFRVIMPVVMFFLTVSPATSVDAVSPVNKSRAGIALKGYDPVAYFTRRKPVKGKASISLRWRGAVWHFASAGNRALFRKSPAKYAPRYGGYCAWAVSQGYTAPIDPRAWAIVKGRLYLNYDLAVQKQWAADKFNLIRKADVNWPRIIKK